tara:strand:- start:2692 stop:5172 length:2481 start_codon:yes stop_codon:yes gene_type:complete
MSSVTDYNKEVNMESILNSFDDIKLNQKSQDLIECITKEKEEIKLLVGKLNELSQKTEGYKGKNFERITKNGAVEGKKTLEELNEFKELVVKKTITEYEIVEKVYRIKNLCDNNSDLCKNYEHLFEDPSFTVINKEIGANALKRLERLKEIEKEIEDQIKKEAERKENELLEARKTKDKEDAKEEEERLVKEKADKIAIKLAKFKKKFKKLKINEDIDSFNIEELEELEQNLDNIEEKYDFIEKEAKIYKGIKNFESYKEINNNNKDVTFNIDKYLIRLTNIETDLNALKRTQKKGEDEEEQKNDDEIDQKNNDETGDDEIDQKNDDEDQKNKVKIKKRRNVKKRKFDEEQKIKVLHKRKRTIKNFKNDIQGLKHIPKKSKDELLKIVNDNKNKDNLFTIIQPIVHSIVTTNNIIELADKDVDIKNDNEIDFLIDPNKLREFLQEIFNNKQNEDYIKNIKNNQIVLYENLQKNFNDHSINIREQLIQIQDHLNGLDDNNKLTDSVSLIVKRELLQLEKRKEKKELLNNNILHQKLNNVNTQLIFLKDEHDKISKGQEIINEKDNELNKLKENLNKEKERSGKLTNELSELKKKLNTTEEEKEQINKLTEQIKQSNTNQEKLEQVQKEKEEVYKKKIEEFNKEKKDIEKQHLEQIERLNKQTEEIKKLQEEKNLLGKEHKIKKMAEDCEKHRVEAEIIFDNLKMNLEEGLKSTQINDLQKKLIIVKAKEFELCHILHIYRKNLQKEKQKIIDMKDLMKEEDNLWNKIFPKKEKEEREIIGKIKEINLQDIKKNIRNFMKNNFCYLWDKDRIEEKFGIGNYLESIVEQ